VKVKIDIVGAKPIALMAWKKLCQSWVCLESSPAGTGRLWRLECSSDISYCLGPIYSQFLLKTGQNLWLYDRQEECSV